MLSVDLRPLTLCCTSSWLVSLSFCWPLWAARQTTRRGGGGEGGERRGAAAERKKEWKEGEQQEGWDWVERRQEMDSDWLLTHATIPRLSVDYILINFSSVTWDQIRPVTKHETCWERSYFGAVVKCFGDYHWKDLVLALNSIRNTHSTGFPKDLMLTFSFTRSYIVDTPASTISFYLCALTSSTISFVHCILWQ